MFDLTTRQNQVLSFITQQIVLNHCPPTVREIMSVTGIKSPNAVCGHLKALVKKGKIEIIPNKSRNIRLIFQIVP